MNNFNSLIDRIFSIDNQPDFDNIALSVFHYQSEFNTVYRDYIKYLGIDSKKIKFVEEIPFMPVEFFKQHKIICGNYSEEIIFSSSGTSGMQQSRHFIKSLAIYEKSFLKGFEHFYGNIAGYCLLALLPAYLEREGSSLVYMAEKMIQRTEDENSGFYLNNIDELANIIHSPILQQKKILLLGVTFALLDLVEHHTIEHPNLIVMETGGMKGRRKELIREDLHAILTKGFNVKTIHSEYGMTELLSQAYSKGEGKFYTPPWMRILIRDANDPLSLIAYEKSGGINIIDLANLHSCSFIMTQDLGKKYKDGSFEVLGRFDASDIRGCNLLVS